MTNIYSLALFRSQSSGYESPRAGTSQGIFFSNFIPTVIRAFRVVWGGWELRIHHDERVKDRECWPLLDRCQRAGLLKLIPMGESMALCRSMLWRIEPLKDARVEWVVCRDVDSLPMHRDRKMVEAAIAAGAKTHLLLDSESHSGLMGGMSSFHVDTWKHFATSTYAGIDMDKHGADQHYLNREIWPHVKAQTLIHQRRRDIQYPDVMKTLPVAPQETPLDKVVRHVGAGFDRVKALEVMKEFYPDPEFDDIENAK